MLSIAISGVRLIARVRRRERLEVGDHDVRAPLVDRAIQSRTVRGQLVAGALARSRSTVAQRWIWPSCIANVGPKISSTCGSVSAQVA